MPVLLISGLVSGWFVFQGWLAGDLTVGLYDGKSFNVGVGNGALPGILDTTSFWAGLWCIAFGFLVVSGMRTMAWFGKFAVVRHGEAAKRPNRCTLRQRRYC